MTQEGKPPAAESSPAPVRILLRIVRFPLTRIVIALVAVAAALLGVQAAVEAVGGGLSDGARMWLAVTLAIVAVHLVYVGYVRLVERRAACELSLEGAPAEVGLGALVGAGVMTASVVVLWIGGFYQVEAIRSPAESWRYRSRRATSRRCCSAGSSTGSPRRVSEAGGRW